MSSTQLYTYEDLNALLDVLAFEFESDAVLVTPHDVTELRLLKEKVNNLLNYTTEVLGLR